MLEEVGISCCGWTSSGKHVTIYNNAAQLTVKNSSVESIDNDVKAFIDLWGK